jgi:hypothetical protein
MSTNSSESYTISIIAQYVKATKYTTLLLGVSSILIILFVVSPLNSYFLPAFIAKVLILLLLGYIIYNKTIQTNKIISDFKINMFDDEWNTVKTNIVFNYLFSGVVIILMYTIINKFFRPSQNVNNV